MTERSSLLLTSKLEPLTSAFPTLLPHDRMISTILLILNVVLGYYFFVFAEVEPCMVNPIVLGARPVMPVRPLPFGSRPFNSFALTLLASPLS